jgi:hypothetical protein
MYMSWGGWKTALNRCCICRCRPVHTRGPVFFTMVFTCNHTHHGVYICTHVGAFFLFVLSNLSATCVCIRGVLHACVSQVFSNTACMFGRGLEVVFFFSLFMVGACCWRGRLYFGRGRDRGSVLYISLCLRLLGWWVCACLYMRVHTHTLRGYLM